MDSHPQITVDKLTLAYGSFVVMKDLSFVVERGAIFFITGGSGSGKSTVLRALIGLQQPASGAISYDGDDFLRQDETQRELTLRRIGVLYQSGGLFSSMTVGENVGLPLTEFTDLSPDDVREVATLKLSLVGLAGFEDFYPAELSGGMQKRAGIARAMALDPEILFLDEPSAGLDPVTSHRLDDLILDLRRTLGMSFVIVTHELASIFRVADRVVYLDADKRTMTAIGPPRQLLDESGDPDLVAFLSGGEGRPKPGAAP
jgi:phospholipid/cholesterol/gamma-HCH transport system ATP-binding protein